MPNIEEGKEKEVTHSISRDMQLIKAANDINSYIITSQRALAF